MSPESVTLTAYPLSLQEKPEIPDAHRATRSCRAMKTSSKPFRFEHQRQVSAPRWRC